MGGKASKVEPETAPTSSGLKALSQNGGVTMSAFEEEVKKMGLGDKITRQRLQLLFGFFDADESGAVDPTELQGGISLLKRLLERALAGKEHEEAVGSDASGMGAAGSVAAGSSAQQYPGPVRQQYLYDCKSESATVSDAITGRALSVMTETVEIATTDAKCDVTTAAFDWVQFKLTEGQKVEDHFKVGERVKCLEGRCPIGHFLEAVGTVNSVRTADMKQQWVVVSMEDGTERTFRTNHSNFLDPNYLMRAVPIAGVSLPSGAAIKKIDDLALVLVGSERPAPVLVNAGPGTGKTFSMIKLLHLLATQLLDDSTSALVPLLVPVQQLAQLVRSRSTSELPATTGEALLRQFIDARFPATHAPYNKMVHNALESGQLLLLLDGVDEAAALKETIAQLVLTDLAGRARCVVTTRPEGVVRTCMAMRTCIADITCDLS